MATTDLKRAFTLATSLYRRSVTHRRPVIATFAVLFLLAASCSVDDASPWSGDQRSAARLLAAVRGENGEQTILRAGLEIKLSEGWKTYWRYPGDSGVPPRFDFSQSDNVAMVDVLWPAPHRFSDEGDNSIGYVTDVVMPLRIVPRDRTKPVTLRLKLDYAICQKLCVPADASAELLISGRSTSRDSTLAAAEGRVPKPTALGAAGPLAIRTVRREDDSSQARIIVDLAAPEVAELFAEGPTSDWALPLPEPVPGAPAGLQRFAFALDGLPPGTSPKGARLTLTLVSAGQAIEVAAPLE
ncbi:MAG: protein-disulfide reductase DsbD domain-containing protein [Xanthobacteraceae bacterium]